MTMHRHVPWFCAAMLLFAGSAQAIIMADAENPEAYVVDACAYPPAVVFEIEGRYGSGAGTLISPRHVLTAAHVAALVKPGDVVHTCAGKLSVSAITLHPKYRRADAFADLAVVELAGPVELAPAALARHKPPPGTIVTFVGAGSRGDGVRGVEGFDGKLRHARNATIGAPASWLRFRFDQQGELEGISGPGDSGGPALIGRKDAYVVVGVSSWQGTGRQGKEGLFGVLEYYVDVAHFRSWILQAVGAPR